MERLSVDTIGPLEKDTYGNCYIIVIIDCFTRWVELVGAPDVTAKSAARAILSHTGHFGQAHQLISDSGPQFVNDVLIALCDLPTRYRARAHRTVLTRRKLQSGARQQGNHAPHLGTLRGFRN